MVIIGQTPPQAGPLGETQTVAPKPLPGGEAGLGLAKGMLVKGELLNSTGKGEGVFSMEGRVFRALYPPGITPGTPITLKVVDPGPPLILELPDPMRALMDKLVHPSSASFASTASDLLKSGSLGNTEAGRLLDKIVNLLKLPQEPEALAKALQNYFSSSGIFSENMMAGGKLPGDMKEFVARLLSMLGDQADSELVKNLKALLSHIEAHQARSLMQDSPVVPFFLNWGGENIRGEITVQKDQKGGGEDGAGGMTIRLDMPNLGRVESALWWNSAGLSVALRVDPRLEKFVSERLGELSESLGKVPGINLGSLRVEPLEPPKRLARESLLEITV